MSTSLETPCITQYISSTSMCFGAYLGLSSGGTTVCIQQLVLIILFRWLSVVLVGLEDSNPTRTRVSTCNVTTHVYCGKPFATIFTGSLHGTTQWWVSYFYFLHNLLTLGVVPVQETGTIEVFYFTVPNYIFLFWLIYAQINL